MAREYTIEVSSIVNPGQAETFTLEASTCDAARREAGKIIHKRGVVVKSVSYAANNRILIYTGGLLPLRSRRTIKASRLA